MNLVLRTEVFNRNKVTLEEVLSMIVVATNSNIEKGKQSLIEKGLLYEVSGNLFEKKLNFSTAGKNILNEIILDSNEKVPKAGNTKLSDLVGSMRALFPKGYQQHNPDRYPWRGSPKEIEERMRGFFNMFGTDYEYEDIIKATERYVKRSINDPYMKTLPYFIWSKQEGPLKSLLASELAIMKEGDEEEKQEGEDWKTNIV